MIVVPAPTLAEGVGAIVDALDPIAAEADRRERMRIRARLNGAKGRMRSQRAIAARRQTLLDEFLFLHTEGGIPWHLSRKERCRLAGPHLGMSWTAVERMLDRHGDPTDQLRRDRARAS